MSKRYMRAWPIIGLVLVSVAPGPPYTTPSQDPVALAKARLDVIRRVYDLKKDMRSRGQAGIDLDQDYLWSRRLLEAERDATGKKQDDLPALEAHLDRMKELETLAKQAFRAGEASALQAAATEFYRVEAEFWLAQARTK